MKVLKKIGRVIVNLFMTILLVAAVVLTAMSSTLNGMFDAFISAYSVDTDQDKLDSLNEQGTETANQIEGEGLVLVQNNNDSLPLSSDVTKVNVFGWAATDWLAAARDQHRFTEEYPLIFLQRWKLRRLNIIRILLICMKRFWTPDLMPMH